MIDVAGLVPGAHEGKGLGNQFLDDLRHADALIHVVDVSGTTNEKGEATVGYDPINDIDWLRSEIHSWIYNNLKGRWSGIVRRHIATKNTPAETFQAQLSGYGANHAMILRFCDKAFERLGNKALDTWDDSDLHTAVDAFLDVRFPTVVACNKIDLPDADKNITKLVKKYDESMLVFTSALSEIFLRKLAKTGYIRYEEGSDDFRTADDAKETAGAAPLKPLDEKNKGRLEKIRDLVLYRYGSTGTQEAISRAVESLGMLPVYPVRNINNFTSDAGQVRTGRVFRDCYLVRQGTTVRDLVRMLPGDMERFYNGAETVGGIQISDDEVIMRERNIIAFRFGQYAQNDLDGS
eukprot:Unigene5220_Nuclearia_a/m.16027 Unigene5220_Nuclearia_a/g.16027  ORF Unigene5220_Nuclearia_a/g.16027 Unigene5220_Nuclearia_a/m.16027 type:complete len:350 (-) Unigene5220_Nuclearia_a:5-1054(-)